MKSKEELQTLYNNADDLEKLMAAHVITNELLCDIRGLLVSINQKKRNHNQEQFIDNIMSAFDSSQALNKLCQKKSKTKI